MEIIKDRAARVGAAFSALFVLGVLGAGAASATPADPVETAFTDMEGKITTYGGAIVALVVLSIGIMLGIKYLRKGVSKA